MSADIPMQKPTVLIAGAGPVGMYAALALAQKGAAVRIVDPGLWPCAHSYALALHPASIALLSRSGISLDDAYLVDTIRLCDAGGERAALKLPQPLAVLRQSVLESRLETALRNAGLAIEWNREVAIAVHDADHVTVTLEPRESTDVEFVLGADGHSSRVRQSTGIEFPEVAPAQYYAVFEFKSDFNTNNAMRVVLGNGTSDLLWPLPGGCCRWSFQLPEYSDIEAEQYKDRLLAYGLGHVPTARLKDRASDSPQPGSLDGSYLRALIAERAPWFNGSIENLSWGAVVRFERRLAHAFGRGRIWLAGDAAHLASPGGVQSMNSGLVEAAELAALFASNAVPPAFENYNSRWVSTWRQLQGVDGGLHATSRTDPWIASNAGRLAACLPAYGDDLVALAAQLELEAAAFETAASGPR